MRKVLAVFARMFVVFLAIMVASQLVTAEAITRPSYQNGCELCELSYDPADHLCTLLCVTVSCRVCPHNRSVPQLFICVDEENVAPPACNNGEVSVLK